MAALARPREVEGARAKRLADAAERILTSISSGQALTSYMHRSPPSAGHFTAHGDVFPQWVPNADGRGGEWYGSLFGRPPPVQSPPGAGLNFHVTNKSLTSTTPASEATPRYYTDCAGFVRELLSSVFPPSRDLGDPKQPLLDRARGNDVPPGDRHQPRNYPRAHIFFHEFNECPDIDECIPGNDEWGRVSDPRQLRRGDVVVEIFHGGEHTGHMWVVATNPNASGAYDAAESSSAIGGVNRRSRRVDDLRDGFLRGEIIIGRLVEAHQAPAIERALPAAGGGGARGARYRVRQNTTALMRRGQDLDSAEVGHIPSGTVVSALESDAGSRRILVETAGGYEGWVTKRFLDVDEDVGHPNKYSDWHSREGQRGAHAGCRVGERGANLRRRAELSNLILDDANPVLFVIPRGEPLKKKAERIRVRWERAGVVVEGWVSALWLERC